MVKCEQCAREFRTQQGLVGHLRFVHGIKPNTQQPLFPPKRFITDEDLEKYIRSSDELMATHSKVETVLMEKVQQLEKSQKELEQVLLDQRNRIVNILKMIEVITERLPSQHSG